MQIYILGNKYEYLETDTLDDFGECDRLNRVIRVRNNQNRDQLADSILHEVSHAIWELMALPEKAAEERVATAMGRGFGSLLRDPRNEDFMSYLNSLSDFKKSDSRKHSEGDSELE